MLCQQRFVCPRPQLLLEMFEPQNDKQHVGYTHARLMHIEQTDLAS